MKSKFPEGKYIFPNVYVDGDVIKWRNNGLPVPPHAIPEKATDKQKAATKKEFKSFMNALGFPVHIK